MKDDPARRPGIVPRMVRGDTTPRMITALVERVLREDAGPVQGPADVILIVDAAYVVAEWLTAAGLLDNGVVLLAELLAAGPVST